MAKVMTTDQWIRLACSKDSTRSNLLSPWSNGKYWLATDGHRMHFTPTSIPAYTGEFPDASQILTKIPEFLSATIVVDPGVVKKLRALDKCARVFSGDKSTCVLLSILNGNLMVSVDSGFDPKDIFTVTACPAEAIQAGGWRACVNLSYFADAIDGAVGLVEVRQKGKEDPIFITQQGDRHACVMPMRDSSEATNPPRSKIERRAKALRAEISRGIQA